VGCFTFYCLPGLVPVPRFVEKGWAKCHMSASQVFNAPIYYTTLAANDASPDPTFCNQCKPLKPIAFHRCKSSQIFGGTKDLPKFPEICPKKNCKENCLKKWLHFIPLWAQFFQIKALQAPFLPKFPLTCLIKNLRNMTSKKTKRLQFDFRRHFCKIKAHKVILRIFSHILPKFTHILNGF